MRNYQVFFKRKQDEEYFNNIIKLIADKGEVTHIELCAIRSTGFPINHVYSDYTLEDSAKEFNRKINFLKNKLDMDKNLTKKRRYLEDKAEFFGAWQKLKSKIRGLFKC